ncbi:MAG TPA: S4 domain-containing protein, partial [Deltaproteobacteria bacterium]|nr:S4 domain-containing protein [Deltaproteobacteria bacterium]
MAEEIRLSAEKEDAGARLDIFLSQRLRMTRSAAANLIEKGSVLVDSVERRPSFRLKQGMTVQVLIEQKEEPDTLKAYDLPLDILYEDQWIIVINKPAGLVVHP